MRRSAVRLPQVQPRARGSPFDRGYVVLGLQPIRPRVYGAPMQPIRPRVYGARMLPQQQQHTPTSQPESDPQCRMEAPIDEESGLAEQPNNSIHLVAGTDPHLRPAGTRQVVCMAAKRVLDVANVLLLAPLWLPLYLLICAMILIVDGSPVHYPDVRVGRFGREFACLKFRSMRSPARDTHLSSPPDEGATARESSSARFEKAVDDPRVTKLGRILRRWSLDELPQVINVLRGEMSLVGPRPVTRPELEEYYGDEVPLLLSVPPGLTGLWQISGRSMLPAERRVFIDVCYISERSLRMDLVIMLKTVPCILRGRGAF